MNNKTSLRPLQLAVWAIAISAAGVLIWDFGFKGEHKALLSLTAFAIGMLVFFGSMAIDARGPSQTSEEDKSLRRPIAITIVVTYLFTMPLQVFIAFEKQISTATEAFIQSFTAIVGVVIAFYFGASAAVQIAALKKSGKQEPEQGKDA